MKMKTLSRSFRRDLVTYGMVVVMFLAIQLLSGMGMLTNSLSGQLVPICAYIIMAISLNLTVGILGELSLGHAGFMSVGGFVGAFVSVCVGDAVPGWLCFALALLAGTAAAALFGFLIGIPVLRLQGDYLAIVTLAFGEIIKNLLNSFYVGRDASGFHVSLKDALSLNLDETGDVIINGAQGITGMPRSATFGLGFVLILITLFIVLNLINSRTGRAIMSIRDNRIAAESVGVNVTRYKLIAFTISAALAGLAGALYAHNFSSLVAKKFDYNTSILILVFVVVGGMGNIRGSIIAAALLTILPELLRGFSDYRMLVYAVVLIVMMLFNQSPQLVAWRRRLAARLPLPRKKAAAGEKEGGCMALLEGTNLGIAFGGLQAVEKFALSIEKGHLYGLIGPNGAGKTTVFNMLTGVYQPTEGDIVLDGKSIVGLKPAVINKAGIARTFQNIRLFKDMTVLDNVKVGLHNQVKYTTATGILRLPSYFVKERAMNEKAMELLKIFDLDGEAGQPASSLPYGKQRKLEIARALATNPKLLLLDEPAAGMNPNETAELMETVRFVRDKFDIAVLLIEHDMSFVMGLCEHITVLDYGRIIAEGDPETVRSDPKVIAAYLGGEA